MTTTSSATGSVTSLGIGSNLDLNSIITGLMAAEAQPLTLLQHKASTINTQISAVGRIQSYASAFGDKAEALGSSSLWNRTTSASADASVVTADTSSGTAVPGSYAVAVQQLAQGQTVTSSALASSSSTLSSGTLTIQLGTWSGTPATSFADKAGSGPLSITIGPGDTSLSSIRDKINAAGAGVTASIITDSTGSRLSLRSTATGAENGFKITATEDTDDGDPATGLSALGYDPGAGASPLALNQSATNALATVNGIAVSSASNTLANISDGLSLTLQKVSATPVSVTVSVDTASMSKAISDFVTAYNSLNSEIHTDTKYAPGAAPAQGTSTVDGPLQGDPSVISFQSQLRGILNTSSTASSMYSRLSDIGITIQPDGSLATDSNKLNAAMAHPDQLKALFSTQGTTAADTGIAVRFSNLTTQALGVDGTLKTRSSGLQDQLSRNSDQQTEMQTHLDQTQARLTKQYQALDTTMAQMNALSSYVSQQVTMMEKN
jgi:flagellar hook-associated protein 2